MDLNFHLLDVVFCTAQDGTVLMFPTFLHFYIGYYTFVCEVGGY